MTFMRKMKRNIARYNMEMSGATQINKDKDGYGSPFSHQWRKWSNKDTMTKAYGGDIYEPRAPRKHHRNTGK